MYGQIKIIIYILFSLLSFLVYGQENATTYFQKKSFITSKKIVNDFVQEGDMTLKPKNLEILQSFEPLKYLQLNIPTIFTEKQNLFYTKNEFTGMYNVYNTSYGEVRLYQNYNSYFDFSPTCIMPGPVSNGNAGDLLGAIVRSFLSQADLKIKIGKKNTISFF